ncbi:MAG TPA: hypothetical protein VLF63_00420 [Patescibacteria group bacterium]|nr:hypothetical protein [Patescibacteria group bacterium]
MKLKLNFWSRKKTQGRNRYYEKEKMSVSKTFNYSSRRSEDNLNIGRNNEQEDKNLKKRLKNIVVFALVILLLITIYKLAYLSPNSIVKPINTNQIISTEDLLKYKNLTDILLNKSFFNQNKISIDEANIIKQLKYSYPQIQSVKFKINIFSRRPTLLIDNSQLALLVKNINDQYFEINLAGQVIKEVPNGEVNKLIGLPLVLDKSSLNYEVNKQIFPNSDVVFILAIYKEFKEKGATISSLTLPATSRELDVGLLNTPYFIKFNLDNNDALQQVGTYFALIDHLKSQNITPSKYIDVRLDGRAYYL